MHTDGKLPKPYFYISYHSNYNNLFAIQYIFSNAFLASIINNSTKYQFLSKNEICVQTPRVPKVLIILLCNLKC